MSYAPDNTVQSGTYKSSTQDLSGAILAILRNYYAEMCPKKCAKFTQKSWVHALYLGTAPWEINFAYFLVSWTTFYALSDGSHKKI